MTDFPKLAGLAALLQGDELSLVQLRHELGAGFWGFPGGQETWGESLGATACQELIEEITPNVLPDQSSLRLDTMISEDAGNTQFRCFVVVVECFYTSGEPYAQDEVFDASWIAHNDIFDQELSLSEDVDTVLKSALERRQKMGCRICSALLFSIQSVMIRACAKDVFGAPGAKSHFCPHCGYCSVLQTATALSPERTFCG